jgi:hypothetical protein
MRMNGVSMCLDGAHRCFFVLADSVVHGGIQM